MWAEGFAARTPRGCRWHFVLVAIFAVLPYLNTLSASFVFDDQELVVGNPYATPGMSALAWFTRPSATGAVYRPLTMVSYALNERIAAGPYGYHFTNVCLHALTALVVLCLARALTTSSLVALWTALLFAVHPIHTEAVANIAGRAEILAALFSLVAVHTFATSLRGRRASWQVASYVAFMAGLLSKENTYSILPVLALVAVWCGERRPAFIARRLIPYAVVAVTMVLLRRAVIGSVFVAQPYPYVDNPLVYAPANARLLTSAVVLAQYIGTLFLPFRLSADESFNQIPVVASFADLRLIPALLLIILVPGIVLWSVRRAPVVAFAILSFVFTMAITANVLFPIGTIKAERLLYLPSFAWCLLMGWLMRRWIGRELSGRLLLAASLLAALVVRTWIRNADWHDDYSLFTKTVASSPMSARAHANAAAVFGNAGDLGLARWHYRVALKIHPAYVPAAVGLGRVYEMQGDTSHARRWYRFALREDPGLEALRGRLSVLDASAAKR